MNEIRPGDQLEFDYVNWKGVKAKRRIKSGKLYYGSTKYHIEPQWILRAFDTRKLEFRDFAMKDMSNVKIIKGDGKING